MAASSMELAVCELVGGRNVDATGEIGTVLREVARGVMVGLYAGL